MCCRRSCAVRSLAARRSFPAKEQTAAKLTKKPILYWSISKITSRVRAFGNGCTIFDIYHRHFRKFVGREVHLLEVGIYSGGSLPMWRHYFGKDCRVYGIDIEKDCLVYEDDRTKIFIGDQADRSFWKKVKEAAPQIDILIDDGGHQPEQQLITLEEMLPIFVPVESISAKIYTAPTIDSPVTFMDSPAACMRLLPARCRLEWMGSLIPHPSSRLQSTRSIYTRSWP